jgi:hypothetical protein
MPRSYSFESRTNVIGVGASWKAMRHQAWPFVLAGLAALAGLFISSKPSTAPQAPTVTVPTPKIVELVIVGGKLQSGPRLIPLQQDERVTFKVTSDRSDEMHLHGYDLHVRLQAHTPATLSFTADRSGRFDYELHGAQVELGALEVQPR